MRYPCRMMSPQFLEFTSPLGTCAIVWGDAGIEGVALPERTVAELRARLRRQWSNALPGKAPLQVEGVVEGIQTSLNGQAVDLGGATLNMSALPDFHRRVYLAAREVSFGVTVTYGELARRVQSPSAARAVGQALGRNPFAIIVPCHRVVSASGGLGGFTAHGGVSTKSRLLAIEGALVGRAPTLGQG